MVSSKVHNAHDRILGGNLKNEHVIKKSLMMAVARKENKIYVA